MCENFHGLNFMDETKSAKTSKISPLEINPLYSKTSMPVASWWATTNELLFDTYKLPHGIPSVVACYYQLAT